MTTPYTQHCRARAFESTRAGQPTPKLYFDYDRQVWVKDGVYQDCGHPQPGTPYTDSDGNPHVWNDCSCFGRLHAGEKA